MGLAGRAILQAALVAAQPLLDHQQRLVGARISVARARIGFQRDAGIKMQRAIRTKAGAVLAQRDMAGIIAVEIFAQHLVGSLTHPSAQGVTDRDAFSRDPESHWAASLTSESGHELGARTNS